MKSRLAGKEVLRAGSCNLPHKPYCRRHIDPAWTKGYIWHAAKEVKPDIEKNTERGNIGGGHEKNNPFRHGREVVVFGVRQRGFHLAGAGVPAAGKSQSAQDGDEDCSGTQAEGIGMQRMTILAVAFAAALSACAADMGQGGRYGNFGGPAWQPQAEPPFAIESTYRGVRWFPTHVRYAPDGSHLLVSLCHTMRPELCRIGKYFIEAKEWEILPYEDKRTYRWPVYHPDGREMAVVSGPCDEQYRCPFGDHALVRMRADGTALAPLGDVIASQMSFSPDGRKLIYWRHGPLFVEGRRRAGGGTDVFEMEWATGRERPLTQLRFTNEREGRPLFVENGEAFVFFAQPGNTWGSDKNDGMNYAWVKDAPITRSDVEKLALIWPRIDRDSRFYSVGDIGFDLSKDGRLLYLGGFPLRQRTGDPVSVAILPYQPFQKGKIQYDRREDWDLAMGGQIPYLRQPRADALDEAAFRANKPFDAALSPDARRVAFLLGGSAISYGPIRFRFGLIDQGLAEPTYIDWPRLELQPGRHPAIAH